MHHSLREAVSLHEMQLHHVQVLVWDLRGGTGAPTLGARGPVHHSLREVISLPQLVGAVPDLAAQTCVPSSAVDNLLLDPGDQRRLAFHVGCGWSGARPHTCCSLSLMQAVALGTQHDPHHVLGASLPPECSLLLLALLYRVALARIVCWCMRIARIPHAWVSITFRSVTLAQACWTWRRAG